MRILTKIFVVIICIGSAQITYSQYYLKSKSDSLYLNSDSVLLFVDTFRGALNWQVSSDLENWFSLDSFDDTLAVRIDSTAYFRSSAVEENCNPVFSDTVLLIEKLTITGSHQFTVDSMGGVFLLQSGIKVKIPQGAVNQSVTIEISMLDSLAARNEMPYVRDTGRYFINALQFNPAGFQFNEPIKIKIPADKYKYSCLPKVHFLNTDGTVWSEYNGYLLCSQKERFIELVTDSLNSILIDAYTDVFDFDESTKASDDCLEGLIKVVSESHDQTEIKYSKICFDISDKGYIEFLECQGHPRGEWNIREISEECVPEVTMYINGSPDESMIKVGEPTEITFFTHIKGKALGNQIIHVGLPDGFSEGNNLWGFTGEDGILTFQIHPISENMNAYIYYVGDFEYCLQLIEATANGASESACQITPLKKIMVEDSMQVFIYDECIDPDEIDCSTIKDPECEAKKAALPHSITIEPQHKILNIEQKFPLTALVNLNPYLANYSSSGINWSSSNEDVASVDSKGRVTTYSMEGTATITASLCNLSATSTIEVKDYVCDSAIINVSPDHVYLTEGAQQKINIQYMPASNGIIYAPVIEFTSNNSNVAIVDGNGIISGKGKGQTTVLVSWCEESYSINVEVEELDYCDSTTVVINTDPMYLDIGESKSIEIDYYYSTYSGNLFVPKIEFRSSDSSVASVDSNGIVNAVAKGETNIIVEWCDKTDSIPVIIEPDRYIMSWIATIDHYEEETTYPEVDRTVNKKLIVQGTYQGSVEFVREGFKHPGDWYECSVLNVSASGYWESYNITTTISDCGDEIRSFYSMIKSRGDLIQDDIEMNISYIPISEFGSDQCYVSDPFEYSRFLMHYSTLVKNLGWGCTWEEYADHVHTTQVIEAGFPFFGRPGDIPATNVDCTHFSKSIDIPHYGVTAHWEISIVPQTPE